MSIGISTDTGVGAVCAMRTASRIVGSTVSTVRTRNAAFEIECSIDSWSGASWMYARSWSRYGVSICPVTCSSAVPAVSASTIAPAALPAAVPVLVNATPRPPDTR